MSQDLQAQAIVDALPTFQRIVDRSFGKTVQGWTAELADEGDPEGTVVIKDANGTVRMLMPRDVYEDLRKP